MPFRFRPLVIEGFLYHNHQYIKVKHQTKTMSRGIRDLRDLICVSRLTIRHSDDEIFSSDEDSSLPPTGRLSQLSRKLSRNSLSSTGTSREGSAANQRGEAVPRSPDSGIGKQILFSNIIVTEELRK